MEIRFDGLRALVTGGGRGFGREIARALVKGGAKTYVLTKSDSSVNSIRREDPDIGVMQVNLTDWERTQTTVQSILPFDLLVNNAGVGLGKSFLHYNEKEIDDAFSVNYKSYFNVGQIVAKDMVKRKAPGSIVNISSAASMICFPGLSLYASSKAAVDSLTKYMALELGPMQIRVNGVNPTWVITDMNKSSFENNEFRERVLNDIALGRLGEIEEVVNTVLFLLSDKASLINGTCLPIHGGSA